MKPKQLLIFIASVALTVIGITILRAFPPLKEVSEFLEAKWGQPIIIGLQAGISAGVGSLVLHRYRNKCGES